MGTATGIKTEPFSSLFFILCGLQFCLAADTLVPGQSISGHETLISAGDVFKLGFFSLGDSQNRYIGIWYNKISVFTVVWVANRENPVTDSKSGVLKIGNDGNLMVLGTGNITLWSTNSSLPANTKSTAKLMESGSLVLVDSNSGQILWQSFDYLTNTVLPGTKFGINLRTGHKRRMTSWRNTEDPSPGNFIYEVDTRGLPQFFLWNGVMPYWRSGPWNGQRISGVPGMRPSVTYNYTFTSTKDEIYFRFFVDIPSIISRYLLNESGVLHLLSWDEKNERWTSYWSEPADPCQLYGACGPFSSCNLSNSTFCYCLEGFVPKSSRDWNYRNWSGGCVRRTRLKCGKGDGFSRVTNMQLPDTSLVQVDESLSLQECETKCLSNCSCTAYANSNISGTGSGCIIWSGDLIDLRNMSEDGQEFYLRMASSELVLGVDSQGKGYFAEKNRRILWIALAATLVGTLLLVLCMCYMLKYKKIKGMIKKLRRKAFLYEGKVVADDEDSAKSLGLSLLEFGIIEAATNNFSCTNKLGQGGFGSVYKGKLSNGQEVAVKRLCKSSRQGRGEFENEVMLIAKLQHRNLVRLLGYCTHGEEKILIYEYMPNKSLDNILFDQTKSPLLDWQRRFDIIVGIARGLLYLHQDSRFRIIHRDLKPSNILLDADMNPKISDFGIARIFGGNQIQANTMKVVGTYGYMSPEYAMNGIFSVKSDVFSYGVLLLEIVSGKRTNTFYQFDYSLSLIGYAWKLWKEGKGSELMDPSMGDSCQTGEVLRCIHIGLLCVQESAVDRPNMPSVVFMLGNETANLPPPKKPAFPIGITPSEGDPSSSRAKPSINNVTITMVEAR